MVLVLVTDFVFASRISATAAMDDLDVVITRSLNETLSHLEEATQVIIDANNADGDPLEVIREIKANNAAVPVTVYLSHVQRELIKNATLAGADTVLPRSTFTERLREILSGKFSE